MSPVGEFYLSAGNVIVDGPTNNRSGGLDSNGELLVNGGYLIVAGSSGMAESPEQNSVSITTETHSARTEITIEDSDGDEILSFTSAKSFSNLVFSSEDLENGKTYTVYFDGEAGETFTISSTTTFVGTANGMQIGGGMPMGMPPSGMRR